MGSARQHLWPRRQPGRRALAIGILALTASTANAQFSRYADEIELKRLDFHPKPSFRREVGSEIYGVLDQALIWRRGDDDPHPCKKRKYRGPALDGLSASHLGFRSTETLDSGWLAHVDLEHGFAVDTGKSADKCADFFDRAANVGLSNRLWGRVDLGRQDQPAWHVALLADPWAGNAVASPGDGNYYLAASSLNPALRSRTDDAITYTSPEVAGVTIQVQGAAPLHPNSTGEHGWAISYRGGGLAAAVGWQRWRSDTEALPMAVVYTFDQWRGYAGLTLGRDMGKDFRNLFVGAAIPERSGPHPGEWRFGLNLHRIDGQPSQRKFSAGHVCPFSKRTTLQMELSVEPRPGAATQARLGFGIRHAFTL